MLIVPLQEAKPGMKLAANVPHPADPENDLLKAGFVLEESVIGRLGDLGINVLYIDYPDLRELDQHLLPTLSPARVQLYRQIKATIAAIQKTAKPTVGFADYYVTVRELVLTLMQRGEHPVYVEFMAGGLGADEVGHAAAVAHLSLILGIRLHRYLIKERNRLDPAHAADVVNLGVAGMMHDIGKAKLSRRLHLYSSINPPQDSAALEEWESHPKVGYDMIRGGVESSAAAAVLQHHQHFDGTGFPSTLARDGTAIVYEGSKIHVFARILHAADLYDRLASEAQDEGRRSSAEVLHLMKTHYATRLDPQVLYALPHVVPPFPPGGKVTLSDGSAAVVIALNSDDPYRPFIRRFTSDGAGLEPGGISLAADGALEVESVGGVVVRHLIPARASKKAAPA
ncbi:MAG: metal dependent phosphohydrolase [Phycisphaerales bacterium]|nr:metal dependent phosphohydrolase [Phycisphaerales bacterium]